MDPKWLMNSTHKGHPNVTNATINDHLPPLDALQWPGQLFLICLYSITSLLSLSSNVITIVVLLKGERCAKDMRKFLINLSISDIAMSLFSIPFTYTLYMFGRWIFPPVMCPIVNFVQLSSIIVSIYTLAAIGVDRYFAIVHPLRASMSWFKSHRSLMVTIIWFIAIIIGSTQLIISRSNEFVYGTEKYNDCGEQWSMGSKSGQIYTVVVFVITFAIPMLILSAVYTLMGFTLLRHHLPGDYGRRQQQFAVRKIKVVKMLAMIVILFIICWLPIQVFGLLVWFSPSILVVQSRAGYYTFVGTYFFCHWISNAHSFVNPIIYSFMSENFRADLKALLRHLWTRLESAFINTPEIERINSWTVQSNNKITNNIDRHLKVSNTYSFREHNSQCNTVTTTYV